MVALLCVVGGCSLLVAGRGCLFFVVVRCRCPLVCCLMCCGVSLAVVCRCGLLVFLASAGVDCNLRLLLWFAGGVAARRSLLLVFACCGWCSLVRAVSNHVFVVPAVAVGFVLVVCC